MIAGSQLRDTQGEMLSVEGADISDLEAGRGRFNDNHGKGFYNCVGRVTGAKKIFSKDDCEDDRHRYYWEKVKAPFIYCKGFLYDDEEHPNAKAAAAILRNIHKSDVPLKIKASVEGGVVARGIKDNNLLARTKIHSVALTFTPANQATLVEPLSLNKSNNTWEEDRRLIKSVEHLVKTDVPSFRKITRHVQASTIIDNFREINNLARQVGLEKALPEYEAEELIKKAARQKLINNLHNINQLIKALTAEYNMEALEKASKKQIAQMTGNKDVTDWVSKHLNRDDLALWFARSYKKDPSIFNDENREKLEHIGAVKDQHKELQNLRLGRGHDFDTGMDMLHQANDVAEKRAADNPQLVEPDGKKLMDTGDGYAWYSLGKGSCPKEAKAMGHCGNAESEEEGDDILSLRKEKKVGDKTYHEPHLTFINNNGDLGEMKGRGNEKPAERYHKHIIPLLESDHVKALMGGGYRADSNFSLKDLPEDKQKRLLNKKPDIDPLNRFDHYSGESNRHGDAIANHNDDVERLAEYLDKHENINSALIDPNISNSDLSPMLKFNDFDNHIKPEHIHHILDNNSIGQREIAVKSKHFGPEHMEKAFNDEDWNVRRAAVQSKRFGPEHMERALNDKNKGVRTAAIESKHFGPEHMEKAFNDEDWSVRRAAVESKRFGPEHIEQALNDENEGVRRAAVKSKHFGPEHMERALNDEDWSARMAAVKSKHFGPEHMEKAFNDENKSVRMAAVQSKHFGPEHIEQALNDKSDMVRYSAIESEHFGPEHIERALNDESEDVRTTAVESKHFGPEHMERALNDENEDVRTAAVKSKHFGPEHMERALNDEDWNVRTAAVESKHFDPKRMEKALTAGYGGAAAPTSRSHGAVLQTEALDVGRGFNYFVCQHCGDEQIYSKNQVKCRACQKSLPLEQVRKFLFNL